MLVIISLGRIKQEKATAFFKDTGFWESFTSLSTGTAVQLLPGCTHKNKGSIKVKKGLQKVFLWEKKTTVSFPCLCNYTFYLNLANLNVPKEFIWLKLVLAHSYYQMFHSSRQFRGEIGCGGRDGSTGCLKLYSQVRSSTTFNFIQDSISC